MSNYRLNVLIVAGVVVLDLSIIAVLAFVRTAPEVGTQLATTLVGSMGGLVGFMSRGSSRQDQAAPQPEEGG